MSESETFSIAALANATKEKKAAIEANDFAAAAHWRDRERAQQQALYASGGPRPGHYRIRVDRPDGSDVVAEAPTLRGAADLVPDWREITEHVDIVRGIARQLDLGIGLLIRTLATLDAPPASPIAKASVPEGVGETPE